MCWSLSTPIAGAIRGEDAVRSHFLVIGWPTFPPVLPWRAQALRLALAYWSFPHPQPVGTWVPPIFEPSQAFLFGSLDFIVDRLDVLHIREEALIPAPIGGAPSIGSRTHDDFNDEAPVIHSEQTLCLNPAVSNMYIVIYSLFTISR